MTEKDQLHFIDTLTLDEVSTKLHTSLREILLSPENETLKNGLVSILRTKIQEGAGECLFDIGIEDTGKTSSLTINEYDSAAAYIKSISNDLLDADIAELNHKVSAEGYHSSKYMIRRRPKSAQDMLEIRVASIGNVDAGKSTTLHVLTRGGLDDGRGRARVNLFRHKHEIETGRTSSVGMEILGFDTLSQPVFAPNPTRKLTWEEITAKSAKMLSFIDLAGHEKYLKTTVFGMTGSLPDYVMLIVGANHGIIGMSKEHLGIALALNVPVMVILTKIDMCPAPVLEQTIKQLTKILKSPGCRKIPYFVDTMDDCVNTAGYFISEKCCPIFQISNVTGKGVDILRTFLNMLPFRGQFKIDGQAEFSINDIFSVPFVGCVVSGVVKSGIIHNGDTMYLGPDGTDSFQLASIRSIQRKRVNVPFATAGQSVSFALKRTRRKDVRKGMVMLERTEQQPKATREFVAEVKILFHQTTIKEKYQAMLHVGPVAQTGQILSIETTNPILRTGDRGRIKFRFMQRAEYIAIGDQLLFREGRTKGLGIIKELCA